MNLTLTYGVYLAISIALTVWVGTTLHHRGRIFLVKCFQGNEALADAINHLLLVGFYLVNLGYVCLALKYGAKPHDLPEAIEFLSTKIGLVMLILGVMHFANLYIFTHIPGERKVALSGENPFQTPMFIR